MTIRDSWEGLKAERAELRRMEETLDAKIEKFVAWVTSVSKIAAGVPPDEIVSPVVPAPFSPSPLPPVEPSRSSTEPSGSEPQREPTRGVKATMWRNRADERPVSEGGDPPRMANGVLCQPGDGWRHARAALPAQIRPGVTRRVWARLSSSPESPPAGPFVQTDVGPWLDGTRGTPDSYSPDLEDPWWIGAPGRRPYVETHELDPRGRRDNNAGIDLTPRAAAEITKASGQYPELTVEQLAMRYWDQPTELILDVWVEEIATVHDGPSPHITWAEVSRSDIAVSKGIDNTVPEELRPGIVEFAIGIVEPYRAALGRPIRYGLDWFSWFRCELLNALVSGSVTSDHRIGRGWDIPRTEETWRAIRTAQFKLGVQLNVEPDHYDLKVGAAPGSVAVSWIKGAVASAWEV